MSKQKTSPITVKNRPITFCGEMVRAIVEGRKTQTRLIVKPQPLPGLHPYIAVGLGGMDIKSGPNDLKPDGRPKWRPCPLGQVGDHLWVREAYRFGKGYDGVPPREVPNRPFVKVSYEADRYFPQWAGKLRPGMFMPRWASRITLEKTGEKIQRIQEVSQADMRAEGFLLDSDFIEIWDKINGPGSWDANPWVWVTEFRRIKP